MKALFGKNKETTQSPKKLVKEVKPKKQKEPKKLLFSFGKKSNLKPSETGADIAIEAAKAQVQATKQGAVKDPKKLVTLVIGILAVVLVAILFKMFFLDGANNQIVPTTSAPITQAPVEPVATPAPTPEAAAPTEVAPNPAKETGQALTANDTAVAPANTDSATSEAPAQAAPTEAAPPADSATPAVSSAPLSYEEFLKETENKVYRERNTAPGGNLN